MAGKYVPYIEIEILRAMEPGKIYDPVRDAQDLVGESENIKPWDYIYTLYKMVKDGKVEVVSGRIEENLMVGLRIKLKGDPRLNQIATNKQALSLPSWLSKAKELVEQNKGKSFQELMDMVLSKFPYMDLDIVKDIVEGREVTAKQDKTNKIEKKAGTWSLPDTKNKAEHLQMIIETLQKNEGPKTVVDIENALDSLYGDDSLFDSLDELIEGKDNDAECNQQDAAEIIRLHVKGLVMDYKKYPESYNRKFDEDALAILKGLTNEASIKLAKVNNTKVKIVEKQGSKYLVEYLEGSEKGEKELVRADMVKAEDMDMEKYVKQAYDIYQTIEPAKHDQKETWNKIGQVGGVLSYLMWLIEFNKTAKDKEKDL